MTFSRKKKNPEKLTKERRLLLLPHGANPEFRSIPIYLFSLFSCLKYQPIGQRTKETQCFPVLLLGFFQVFLFSGKSHLPNFNFSKLFFQSNWKVKIKTHWNNIRIFQNLIFLFSRKRLFPPKWKILFPEKRKTYKEAPPLFAGFSFFWKKNFSKSLGKSLFPEKRKIKSCRKKISLVFANWLILGIGHKLPNLHKLTYWFDVLTNGNAGFYIAPPPFSKNWGFFQNLEKL